MVVLVVVLVIVFVGSVGAAVALHRHPLSVAGGPTGWGRAARARFGAVGGPAVVLALGWALTLAVGLGLGFLAKALQSSVDVPVFHWVHSRVGPGHFATANAKFTLTGNTPTTELVTLFAVVLLAAAYGRRAWWLPTAGMILFFFSERYLQKILGSVVDRGHPPTTLGTYPSGGVCRILAVYGGILALTIALHPGLRRGWRHGLWAGLVITAILEAYTRVSLSLHWFTDALFALPVGTLMLLTNAAAVGAMRLPTSLRPPAEPTTPAGATTSDGPDTNPEPVEPLATR